MTTETHPYAAYSVAEWKRQPSTMEVIFGLELPYRAPKSAFGVFIWKWRMWFEVTFALSMLQPWEKVLVVTIVNTVFLLLAVALYMYFPHHLAVVRDRTMYYLLGQDAADLGMLDAIQQLFKGWSWNNALPPLVTGTARDL